jgi:hypothetical protein
MTGSTGSGARRCRMSLWPLSNVSSCCVSGYGSGAGLAHSDLAACPSAGCFDGLAGSVVAWEHILEKREHALGAVGGPQRLRPAFPQRLVLGALLVSRLGHARLRLAPRRHPYGPTASTSALMS